MRDANRRSAMPNVYPAGSPTTRFRDDESSIDLLIDDAKPVPRLEFAVRDSSGILRSASPRRITGPEGRGALGPRPTEPESNPEGVSGGGGAPRGHEPIGDDRREATSAKRAREPSGEGEAEGKDEGEDGPAVSLGRPPRAGVGLLRCVAAQLVTAVLGLVRSTGMVAWTQSLTFRTTEAEREPGPGGGPSISEAIARRASAAYAALLADHGFRALLFLDRSSDGAWHVHVLLLTRPRWHRRTVLDLWLKLPRWAEVGYVPHLAAHRGRDANRPLRGQGLRRTNSDAPGAADPNAALDINEFLDGDEDSDHEELERQLTIILEHHLGVRRLRGQRWRYVPRGLPPLDDRVLAVGLESEWRTALAKGARAYEVERLTERMRRLEEQKHQGKLCWWCGKRRERGDRYCRVRCRNSASRARAIAVTDAGNDRLAGLIEEYEGEYRDTRAAISVAQEMLGIDGGSTACTICGARAWRQNSQTCESEKCRRENRLRHKRGYRLRDRAADPSPDGVRELPPDLLDELTITETTECDDLSINATSGHTGPVPAPRAASSSGTGSTTPPLAGNGQPESDDTSTELALLRLANTSGSSSRRGRRSSRARRSPSAARPTGGGGRRPTS
jgi:hypothetical protein